MASDDYGYADEGERERAQAEARRLQEEAEASDFWRRVFTDRIGRREMWRFFHTEAHAFNDHFAASPVGFPDPHATFFHAGEQSLGLRLYHRCLRFAHQGVGFMHIEHDPRHARPEGQKRRTG